MVLQYIPSSYVYANSERKSRCRVKILWTWGATSASPWREPISRYGLWPPGRNKTGRRLPSTTCMPNTIRVYWLIYAFASAQLRSLKTWYRRSSNGPSRTWTACKRPAPLARGSFASPAIAQPTISGGSALPLWPPRSIRSWIAAIPASVHAAQARAQIRKHVARAHDQSEHLAEHLNDFIAGEVVRRGDDDVVQSVSRFHANDDNGGPDLGQRARVHLTAAQNRR